MWEIAEEAAEGASQDRVCAFERDGITRIAVADGAGGTSGGAAAAEAVVRAVRNLRTADPLDPVVWVQLLADLDLELETHGGETTAVVLAVSGGRIAGASVGDSGAWMIQGPHFEDLTAGQQRKPLLGTGVAVPTLFERSSASGILIVATDGLFKYADPAAICAHAESARALVDLVRLSSGRLQDDLALIRLRLG